MTWLLLGYNSAKEWMNESPQVSPYNGPSKSKIQTIPYHTIQVQVKYLRWNGSKTITHVSARMRTLSTTAYTPYRTPLLHPSTLQLQYKFHIKVPFWNNYKIWKLYRVCLILRLSNVWTSGTVEECSDGTSYNCGNLHCTSIALFGQQNTTQPAHHITSTT